MVVYEGTKAQNAAVSFCDDLMKRFWVRFDFEVVSWSFAELEKPDICQEAMGKAVEAGLIVFATDSGNGLPWHIRTWVQSWLAARHFQEGTLVALQVPGATPNATAVAFLRQMAHKGGMDFLTEVPQHMPDPFAESADVYSARAREVTSVLNGILRQPPPPPF